VASDLAAWGDDPRPLPLQCPHPAGPVGFDDAIFSAMHYRLECRNTPLGRHFAATMPPRVRSFIEPLVGILRHPVLCFPKLGTVEAFLMNKAYMVFDEWTIKRNDPFIAAAAAAAEEGKSIFSPFFERPPVFYFDAGGSKWSDGESQQWVYEHLRRVCLVPDGGMFVWEVTAHDAGAIWATIPGHLKPHYRWFNTFISGEAGS
jgi:hypothetical protein